MDTLTLRGRGVEITLFAPREGAGGLEAYALMASAPLPRSRFLRTDNKRTYRVPPIPHRGFYLAHVFLKEVKR